MTGIILYSVILLCFLPPSKNLNLALQSTGPNSCLQVVELWNTEVEQCVQY